MPVTGADPKIDRILKALGLPEHTVWFELRCSVYEIASVRCEFYPEPRTEDMETELAEFELHRKDDG